MEAPSVREWGIHHAESNAYLKYSISVDNTSAEKQILLIAGVVKTRTENTFVMV